MPQTKPTPWLTLFLWMNLMMIMFMIQLIRMNYTKEKTMNLLNKFIKTKLLKNKMLKW